MNIHKPGIAMSAAALLAIVTLASCSGGSGSTLAPAGGAIQQTGHRVQPLTTVSTRVKVSNISAISVSPSYTLGCWTLSTPFPTLGAGISSMVITETYDLSCGASNTLHVTYGSPDCTFATTYSSGFSYSVNNSAGTACSVTPSHNITYDELLTYDTSTARVRGMHRGAKLR